MSATAGMPVITAWGLEGLVEMARNVLAAGGFELRVAPPPWAGADVVGALVDPDCPLRPSDWRDTPNLRVIATASAGTDHIDVDAARRDGIEVSAMAGYCCEEVAETALALLLALCRGVVRSDRDVRSGAWTPLPAPPLRVLAHERLGLVGFGAIGQAVAKRAVALGVPTAAYDPAVAPDVMRSVGVERLERDDLISGCTALSLHAPLTPATEGMVDKLWLRRMPARSYLVNTARGGLIRVDDLLEALEQGHLAGAALDVLPVEPPVEVPRHPNLIVTSHIGWSSDRAVRRAYVGAAENLLSGLLSGSA